MPGCFKISAICSDLLGSGGSFSCSRFFSACRRSSFISSGIHFRAVGRLIPKSRAHFDTLPPGCSAYQASTCFCCVGAPSLLMYGLSVVNHAIVFTSLSVVFLIISRSLTTAAGSQTAKRPPAGNPWAGFCGGGGLRPYSVKVNFIRECNVRRLRFPGYVQGSGSLLSLQPGLMQFLSGHLCSNKRHFYIYRCHLYSFYL